MYNSIWWKLHPILNFESLNPTFVFYYVVSPEIAAELSPLTSPIRIPQATFIEKSLLRSRTDNMWERVNYGAGSGKNSVA